MNILDQEFRHVSAENQTAVTMLHYDADMLGKDIKNARIALYVLIAANVVGMIVGFYQHDLLDVLLEGLFVIAIYLFSIWFMDRNARTALLIALGVYLLQTLVYAFLSPGTIAKGILLKAVIIYYLVKGIMAAFKIEKIRKSLRQYGEEVKTDLGTVI